MLIVAAFIHLCTQIAAVQVFDMRPFLDLLSHLLMLQDTWQGHRISTALKGGTILVP